jgi:hypothetical protein
MTLIWMSRWKFAIRAHFLSAAYPRSRNTLQVQPQVIPNRSRSGKPTCSSRSPKRAAPVRNRRQRAGETVLCRYLPHHFLACPRLTPDVGEAEEGERGTIRSGWLVPFGRLLRKSTKRVLSGWSVSPYRAAPLSPRPSEQQWATRPLDNCASVALSSTSRGASRCMVRDMCRFVGKHSIRCTI